MNPLLRSFIGSVAFLGMSILMGCGPVEESTEASDQADTTRVVRSLSHCTTNCNQPNGACCFDPDEGPEGAWECVFTSVHCTSDGMCPSPWQNLKTCYPLIDLCISNGPNGYTQCHW
jgi:hypothetical protein